MNRRQFVETASLVAAGLCTARAVGAADCRLPHRPHAARTAEVQERGGRAGHPPREEHDRQQGIGLDVRELLPQYARYDGRFRRRWTAGPTPT